MVLYYGGVATFDEGIYEITLISLFTYTHVLKHIYSVFEIKQQ